MKSVAVKMRGFKASKRALVDDEDYEQVKDYSWREETTGYARAHGGVIDGKAKLISMHRLVMGAVKGQLVDHINGDRLDNRKENLRFCDKSQNAQNSVTHKGNYSGLKGACWFKPRQLWRSQIRVDGKSVHLGYFDTKEEAHEAYKQASLRYHGAFSPFQHELQS